MILKTFSENVENLKRIMHPEKTYVKMFVCLSVFIYLKYLFGCARSYL